MSRLEAIVDALEGKKEGSQYRARCPVHGGRALIIGSKNGTIVLHCHAGCRNEDVIAALVSIELWDAPKEEDPDLVPSIAGGTTENRPPKKGETDYPYYVGGGEVMAIHKRIDGPDGKQFAWWRPGAKKPGLGTVKMADLPLYNAHLIPSDTEAVVWFVEGEKAADACVERGILAVTNAGGSSQTAFGKALEILMGRDVVLWPDNDPPGRSLMQRLHMELSGTAARVRTIMPPARKGDDAFDYFAAGRTLDQLTELLSAVHWQPWLEQSDAGQVVSIPDSGGYVRFEFAGISHRFHQNQADVSVWQGIEGLPKDKFSASLNVLSTSNREGFRRQLDEMFTRPKGYWTNLLNRACDMIRQAEMDTDPSVVLKDALGESEGDYLLRPFVLTEGPTILFGQGDSGKTYFALRLVL